MIFSQNLFRRPTPARLTRIEKSLSQAHFRSVNYCQYNFVEHRTLIYVPACFLLVLNSLSILKSPLVDAFDYIPNIFHTYIDSINKGWS
ncbi:Protein of uncharacterised function (DUF3125) [Staphylococcus aureus]|nr:Protein of uncharacterised function (DUF3125) [Staphylococcus aureus]